MSMQHACVLPLAFLATALTPAPDTLLKARDHEKLGKLVGAYYEAKLESSGISESFEELSEAIGKIEKKSKDGPFLSMVEDVAQVLYYSRKYKDTVVKGRLKEDSFEGYYGDVEYAVHAPKAYKSSKGPFGLLLCLPDRGQSLQQHLDEDWMGSIRDEMVLVVVGMPEDETIWPTLEGGVGNTLQVLRVVREQFALDVDRVYIAGRGASVPVAMNVGEMFPHVFAGVIGRAGDAGEGVVPTNFRNLPTFFAGGGANCTAFGEAAGEDEIESCRVEPDAKLEDILTWIKETSRDANPTRISLAPTTLTGKAAYWLELEGFDPTDGPRVDARIDREANTITVEGSQVSSVRLYLNDLLVDMDSPIKVVVNGASHELELPRRLDFTLEQAFKSGDTGRVYTNSYFFDLAARE